MKRLIIILLALFCTIYLTAGTIKQEAKTAIGKAEACIQKASKNIPFQFQFNTGVNNRISQAENNLIESKGLFENKRYSRALVVANDALDLSFEAIDLSNDLVEQMEQEISAKITKLKSRNNNNIAKELIFEAENLFQQKNYYECLKKIDEIKEYRASFSPVRKRKSRKAMKNATKKIIKSVYKVKYGDCLWNIAAKVYKDPLKWIVIYKANKINNSYLIYPGQELNLPRK